MASVGSHSTTPITEEQIRALRVGDVVVINGEMHTGRDALHKYLMDHDAPVDLNGGVIYHCGPVMLKDEDGWHVKAAGPTTSIREEPYQSDIIKNFGIRAVIGKGGMGTKTLAGLQEHGAVYLNAIGCAAQYYAQCLNKVNGVDFMEFGIPEAMSLLRFICYVIAVYLVWKPGKLRFPFIFVILQYFFAFFGYGKSHLRLFLFDAQYVRGKFSEK